MKPERNATFDVARGFTVFIMPAVHSVMLYSSAAVRQGITGNVLGFLAEGPGAQLFLLLMGLSITLSKRKTPRQVVTRALYLLGLAYLLNYVRLVIPLSLYPMPEDFLNDMGISATAAGKLPALLMGDILQTAAISYLVCGLLFLLPRYHAWAIGLVAVVIACTPWLRQADAGTGAWLFVNLFTGKPPAVFFPVIPWIAYPLAGLAMGSYFKQLSSSTFYRILLIAGLLLFIAGKIIMLYEPRGWNDNFYCPGPGGILYHLGIVCMWLFLCNSVVILLRNNFFFGLLTWLSRHITLIYFVQWMVVLWLLPVYSYHRLNLGLSISALLLNSAIAFGLSYLLIRIQTGFPAQAAAGTYKARQHNL